MVAYESGLRTGEIPLLPLHVAEHCKGARQGPGVYRATMLFPSMGIGVLLLIIAAHWQKMLSTFVRSGCLRFTRCQGLLLPRPGACSFPLPVAPHAGLAQPSGLSSVNAPYLLRRRVSAAGSERLFLALTHSIPSPGLPGCGRRGPAAWRGVDRTIHRKISGALSKLSREAPQPLRVSGCDGWAGR